MTKFSVGDTVRRIRFSNGHKAKVGQLATVMHVEEGAGGFISVMYPGHSEDFMGGEGWAPWLAEKVDE